MKGRPDRATQYVAVNAAQPPHQFPSTNINTRLSMKHQTVEITPKMAAAWLQKIPEFQRKIRVGVVESYARDMAAGNWPLTHQGIAFDKQGQCVDGQHRLAAILKAGVAVKMLVTHDAPEGTYNHSDIGYGRTTADVFRAQGDGWITSDHIAVARIIESNGDSNFVVIKRSPAEIRTLVEHHKNAMHFVFQNIERKVKFVTVAPVVAAIAAAWYHEKDRVRLASFVRLMVSGMASDPVSDATAIRFREWLRDGTWSKSGAARMECYFKAQRVVKAYMRNEQLSKLYTPSEIVYPLKQRLLPLP